MLLWAYSLPSHAFLTVTYAVLLLFLLLVAAAAYRIFFHPLSRVPGPRLAAVSNVWYAYQVRNGHAFVLGKTLHKKYGPVVRVGPNEVWFASAEGFKSIYSKNQNSRFHYYRLQGRARMLTTGDLRRGQRL